MGFKKCIPFILLLLVACRYKDGPVISFHSVKKRLLQTWEVESLHIDGVDHTQEIISQPCYSPLVFTEVRDRGDILLKNQVNCGFHGSWNLHEHKTVLSMAIDYSSGSFMPVGAYGGYYKWTILKLTRNKLWLEVRATSGKNFLKLKKL